MASRMLRRLTLCLGVLSSLSIVVAHLALTDISRGEADLSSEWLVVQVAFGVMIGFHIAALAMLIRQRDGSRPR